MYRTQLGERILGEKEALVFKAMLRDLLVWFDPSDDENRYDDDATSFGIPIFDAMSFGQKLWSLCLVAKALLRKEDPCPPLHAFVEATVAIIFTRADVLLDMEKESEEALPFRAMLADAIRELDDPVSNGDGDGEALDSASAVQSLEESILWDNDFLDTDRLDKDPEFTRGVNTLLGIPDDYFLEVANDPSDSKLRSLFNRLLALTGDEGIFIQRVCMRVTFTAKTNGLRICESDEGDQFSLRQKATKQWPAQSRRIRQN